MKSSANGKGSPLKRKQSDLGDKKSFWELRLYVAGHTPNSIAAIENLKRICEEQLQNSYRIEVIDILLNPQRAKEDQIVAIPTLIRQLPAPLKRVIGNLSRVDRTLLGLELERFADSK